MGGQSVLPIHKIIWHEWRARHAAPGRVPEPSEAMDDPQQIRAYVQAYEWGGPTSALQLYHLRRLATLLRPGDTVLDLACGPGPLLLELAPLYPGCRFIGADLSPRMLQALRAACAERGIGNIETLCEDIRELPSLRGQRVDLVISTSALHHLPDEASLRQALRTAAGLLRDDGGVYLFDFGLLRSAAARALMVAHIDGVAPPITVHDYALSLRAAFPVAVAREAVRAAFGERVRFTRSAFVDFFFFVGSAPRARAAAGVAQSLRRIGQRLPLKYRVELQMLQRLQVGA
jgi:SAM-dependent methyltransferase